MFRCLHTRLTPAVEKIGSTSAQCNTRFRWGGWSFFWVLLCGFDSFATELTQVTVEGEDRAQIYFFAKSLETLPSLSLRENVLELSFPGVTLSSESADKIELAPSHPLLSRISVFPTLHGIKAHVVIRGSQLDLKDRVRVERHPKGVRLNIDFPKGQATALGLLQQEELPIVSQPPKTRDSKKNTGLKWVISLGALCIAAVAFFFGLRMIRHKSHQSGHRKYLIENISFCSLGPKSGVALLKIGKEFILVGVTPGRISMLSALSKLSLQYEEETQYERSAFKEVVSEEYQRLPKSRLSV